MAVPLGTPDQIAPSTEHYERLTLDPTERTCFQKYFTGDEVREREKGREEEMAGGVQNVNDFVLIGTYSSTWFSFMRKI